MDKLRGYEKANEEIVNAISVSTAEIITLNQELYSGHKGLSISANKSGAKTSKFGGSNNENSEIVKNHYEDTSVQINKAKSRNTYIYYSGVEFNS